MALEISCPECGESEDLQGVPTATDMIEIVCGSCATAWTRDPKVRCPKCDSADTYAAPVAVIEKARGTQLSIVSTTSHHFCWNCDRDLIDEQRRSGTALMPDRLPTLDEHDGAPPNETSETRP